MGAVQRRDRHQVKHGQCQVDKHHPLEHHIDRRTQRPDVAGHKPHDQAKDQRQDQVGRRSGQRNPEFTEFFIAEVKGVDRHRFCPAKNYRRVGQKQQKRHQNRSDRINVRNGIQRKPAGVFGRRIAQLVGHGTVGHLVDDDGKQKDDQSKNYFYSCHKFSVKLKAKNVK